MEFSGSGVYAILAVIIMMTVVLTIGLAVVSMISFKIRKRRRPEELEEEVPHFFRKYYPDRAYRRVEEREY